MRRRASYVLMTAATVAASGCAVDQGREVERYRSVVELSPWTEDHRPGEPMSLDRAVRLTNALNERLSIEGENYLQALIDRQRAAASFLPTLDVFANLVFREHVGDSQGSDEGDGRGSTQNQATVFDGGLRAQYTLFSGGSNRNRLRAAEATIEQRRWLLLDLRESLLLEAARSYYAVLRAERLVRVLESSVSVQEERLRDIRGRQEVGFARPLDVAQIEAQASQTRVSLLDARNQVVTARSGLGFLTGVEVHDSALTDGFDVPASVPSLDAFFGAALAARQDLAAAEAAARAARARVDAEIGRYYPTVSVNLDYFLTRETIPTDRDWTGLLTLNFPVFSAGRIDADVRGAWSAFRQRVMDYSLTRRALRRDVETAYADLLASVQRLDELRRQLAAAQEALRQAEASYQAGLGTNLERIAAQDQVLSAQVGLASEEFVRKVSYLAVLRAAGAIAEGTTGVAPVEAPPARMPPASPFVNLPGAPDNEQRPKQD